VASVVVAGESLVEQGATGIDGLVEQVGIHEAKPSV